VAIVHGFRSSFPRFFSGDAPQVEPASVKVMHLKSELSHELFCRTELPVRATARPFDGDTPAVCATSACSQNKVPPELALDFAMRDDFISGAATYMPIEILPW